MLRVGSALKGYAIQAKDDRVGTVSDFLFDDKTWKVRWLVVDTGTWLTGRTVLLQPSCIRQVDDERHSLTVNLKKAQVEASPNISQDQPVSRQMQYDLYDYYGWDPMWGGSMFERGTMDPVVAPASYDGDRTGRAFADAEARAHDGDPDLRSMNAVLNYHIRATDGTIGHLENILIEDDGWVLHYLIVDTRNWWPGQHVLISPVAVRALDWTDRQIEVSLTRAAVKASPPWDPTAIIDDAYRKRLHLHYAWPGYGW